MGGLIVGEEMLLSTARVYRYTPNNYSIIISSKPQTLGVLNHPHRFNKAIKIGTMCVLEEQNYLSDSCQNIVLDI